MRRAVFSSKLFLLEVLLFELFISQDHINLICFLISYETQLITF